MKYFIIIVYIILGFHLNYAISQDVAKSQFLSYPLLLNPSLSGASECPRVTFGFHKAFNSFTDRYNSGVFSFDVNLETLQGGAGFLINYDQMGAFSKINLSLIYSYYVKISREINASFAIGGGIHQSKIDWGNLTFGDMIDPIQGFIFPSSEKPPSALQKITPDFSFGLSIFYLKNHHFGFAIHHINQPDISFFGEENSYLYRKYSLSWGSKIILDGLPDDKLSVTPNLLYQQQYQSKYFQVGILLDVDYLSFGTWYSKNLKGSSGVIFFTGIRLSKSRVGYSYETTFSKTKTVRDGIHEISVQIRFNKLNKKLRGLELGCPLW